MPLEQLLPNNLFGAMLIFVRVGAALSLLPTFGELLVPQRVRLLLAVALAILLSPVMVSQMPALPSSPLQLSSIIAMESMAGAFIGILARIMLATLETAGMVVSLQLGLSSVLTMNPLMAQQGAIVGALYGLLGTLVILMTDTHHLMLRAVVNSYSIFPPGGMLPIGDLTETITRTVGASFRVAIEISSPFIVVGTVFNIGVGVISRLVPQVQIYFVTLPAQIIGGLILIVFLLAASLRWFLEYFTTQFTSIIPG